MFQTGVQQRWPHAYLAHAEEVLVQTLTPHKRTVIQDCNPNTQVGRQEDQNSKAILGYMKTCLKKEKNRVTARQ